ncbi:hypothetical protein RE6C_03110 [Rhodopirellula europaea 6C]|uniref:Uncharacterized protein n=1 Tax=Rhodopirellula europaea 6C TaxID=1263867 RepID=M2ATW4_9BACT|nr:hypothetical protein RE6C_03110 [Rhodopirellula europaea 6C]
MFLAHRAVVQSRFASLRESFGRFSPVLWWWNEGESLTGSVN